MGYEDGVSLYAYVHNNSLTATDASGYSRCSRSPIEVSQRVPELGSENECEIAWEAQPDWWPEWLIEEVPWPLDYQYGCYCGYGNAAQEINPVGSPFFPEAPEPVDEVDECCREHDDCYLEIEEDECVEEEVQACDSESCECLFVADAHSQITYREERAAYRAIYGVFNCVQYEDEW